MCCFCSIKTTDESPNHHISRHTTDDDDEQTEQTRNGPDPSTLELELTNWRQIKVSFYQRKDKCCWDDERSEFRCLTWFMTQGMYSSAGENVFKTDPPERFHQNHRTLSHHFVFVEGESLFLFFYVVGGFFVCHALMLKYVNIWYGNNLCSMNKLLHFNCPHWSAFFFFF